MTDLTDRLNRGWDLIESQPRGSPAERNERKRIEDFWIALLHEYEQAERPPEPPAPREPDTQAALPIKQGS